MTAPAGEQIDFGAASERAAAPNSPEWLRALRARSVSLANEATWPDSHAKRPWKYYDSKKMAIAPDTGFAGLSIESIAGDGATVSKFSAATGSAEKTLGGAIATAVLPQTDRFTALHYAFLREGALVEVTAGAEVAEPVRLTQRVSGGGLCTPHTLIVTGANSRVTVIDEFSSGEEATIVLPVVEIIAGPGSVVNYYAIHRWGAKTKVFLNQRLLASAAGAELQNLHLVLGGEVVKGHLESSLTGRGSSSELLGLSYGTGAQHVDFYTLQDHIGADTRSDLLVKSALKDKARSVYYGLTRVGLGAKNADANQENRNILLSKTAKADSDPVLEILTNDIIRASHGATVGPVDEEQLFYLQARGIPRREAEAMLVRAFLGQVLGRISNETVREEFENALDAKLEAN